MGIDAEKYFQPATRANVGRVTINTVVALGAISNSLKEIKAGRLPKDDDLKALDKAVTLLHEHFNELSGWTDGA